MRASTIVLTALLAVYCTTSSSVVEHNPSFGGDNALKLLPVDEAHRDPGFHAFRQQLLSAVDDRDAQFVMSVLAPELHDLGRVLALPPSAFAPPNREDAAWAEMARVLSLGGSFTTLRGRQEGRLEFCAPYTYSAYPTRAQLIQIVQQIPGHDHNALSDPWVILKDDVGVRAVPDDGAPILRRLSYDLVIPSGGEAGTPVQWRHIYIVQGREGWVRADQIRSPDDYHACFANIEGSWKMTAFERDTSPR